MLALGLALGIVAVRVKGISFVIITLAMGQVLWGLAYQWVGLCEGDNGIPVAILPSLGPVDLNDPLTLRMTVLAVFAVVALLLVTFTRSPFGLSLRGVRSNEARLAALGYRTGLHRYLAWVIAVFLTGVAGMLYVFVNQLISPATMDFSANGLFVMMAVLGGLGSIWGPALGAVIIVLFQQELSIYVSRWQTLMGLTLIAVVLLSPGGIWGLVRAAGRRCDALVGLAAAPGGPAMTGTGTGDTVPALAADHLCRRFRTVTAVADVSLRVPPGARFGIIGPNGAGKTTLFNLLSGEVRPTAGRVALFGRDVTALRPARRAALGLGRTFQITRVFSDLTVLENLTLALHGLSGPSCPCCGRGAATAARPPRPRSSPPVRAGQPLGAVAAELSHGEVRELEVLLALALRPRVLLLDEPAAGLSPAERVESRRCCVAAGGPDPRSWSSTTSTCSARWSTPPRCCTSGRCSPRARSGSCKATSGSASCTWAGPRRSWPRRAARRDRGPRPAHLPGTELRAPGREPAHRRRGLHRPARAQRDGQDHAGAHDHGPAQAALGQILLRNEELAGGRRSGSPSGGWRWSRRGAASSPR